MLVYAVCALGLALTLGQAKAAGSEIEAMQVTTSTLRPDLAYEGVVEAVKQTVLAAQVAGAIVHLDVKAGDRVKAGQLLARIDARAAEHSLAASRALARSAEVGQELAAKDFERQRQLFEKGFISRAAFERADTEYRAARAQSSSQIALADGARTQTAFHLIRAPYAGIVSDVSVMLGDMAMPGKPLITLFDPSLMRVVVSLPQSAVRSLREAGEVRIAISEGPTEKQILTPISFQVLPSIDPGTHKAQLRLGLPEGTPGLVPGQFVRATLRGEPGLATTITVPVRSLVQRAEMTGVYVIDANGRPRLRQVRLGVAVGDRVEVLAGLSDGERIALDPQAAARAR